MKTAILILNWNGAEDTITCLQSLVKVIQKEDYIFVIDNCSKDNSIDLITSYLENTAAIFKSSSPSNLKEQFDESCHYYLVQNNVNAGFGTGNNVVLNQLKNIDNCFEFAWLLNNDAIAEEKSLFYLKEKIQSQSDIGAVGSIVLNLPDTHIVQNTGVKYYPFLGISKLIHKNQPLATVNFKEEIKFDYLNGASLMLDLNALEKIGYFDERYFLYSEEFDLQLRLKKEQYRIELVAESKVYHKLMGSTQNSSHLFFYYYCMSSVLLSKKHYTLLTTILVVCNLSLITFLRSFPSMKNFYWGLKGITKGITK